MRPQDAEVTKPAEAAAPPQQDLKQELLELFKMVALFLVLFWAIKSFVIEGYEVQGESMTPTLIERERILVFKLPHKLSQLSLFQSFTPVRAGDIVVFDSEELNKRYVKRVIAAGPPMPRGNLVDAGHIDELNPPPPKLHIEYRAGKLFVNYAPVEETYLPEPEQRSRDHVVHDIGPGEYFVMGDHRSVSKDSRSFGPIDNSQVVGRAVLRFWPLSKIGLL